MYYGPTETTPTITPTTLKFFEDTSMEFSNGMPIEHKNQACFITPQLASYNQFSEMNHLNNTSSLISHNLFNLNSMNSKLSKSAGLMDNNNSANINSNVDYKSELTGFNYSDSQLVIAENDSNESDISESKYDAKYKTKYDNKNEPKFDAKYEPKYEAKYETKYEPKCDAKYSYAHHNLLNLSSNNGINFTNMQFKLADNLNEIGNLTVGKGKRGSGRRPINLKEEKLTPEEEERRRVRRERNKLAAARCRKRRVDHTNNLLLETDSLEEKKKMLQQEIQELKKEAEQFQLVLKSHNCNFNASQSANNGANFNMS